MHATSEKKIVQFCYFLIDLTLLVGLMGAQSSLLHQDGTPRWQAPKELLSQGSVVNPSNYLICYYQHFYFGIYHFKHFIQYSVYLKYSLAISAFFNMVHLTRVECWIGMYVWPRKTFSLEYTKLWFQFFKVCIEIIQFFQKITRIHIKELR